MLSPGTSTNHSAFVQVLTFINTTCMSLERYVIPIPTLFVQHSFTDFGTGVPFAGVVPLPTGNQGQPLK